MDVDTKYKIQKWKVFSAIWFAYGGFYLTRSSFSVAKIGLAEDPSIGMSNSFMGIVDGLYLLAYALGQFAWGFLGDRFGPRKVVLTGMIGSVIVAFLMGCSNVLILFGVLFCIQGMCQASGWSPLSKNIGDWFPLRERGKIFGWWSTSYAIMGVVATILAGAAADYFLSWRYAFFVPALAFCLIILLFYAFQKNRPEDVGLPAVNGYASQKLVRASESLSKPRKYILWVLGASYFLVKPTRYAILFWSPKYLSEVLGTSMGESALISACFALGGPAGMIISGYISDHFTRGRRVPVMLVSLVILAVLLFFFKDIAQYQSQLYFAIILFWIGFLIYIPDVMLSGTAAVDFGGRRSGWAAGFTNGLGSLGAIMGGALPGIVSDRWGWDILFIGMSVSLFFSAVLLVPLWNATPKKE